MQSKGVVLGPLAPQERRQRAFDLRKQTAEYYLSGAIPQHISNGDDQMYKSENHYATFTKGLPHDVNGEVNPAAYKTLLAALESGQPADFENVVLGSAAVPKAGRLLLVDPQCGLAFELEGTDAHQVTLPPAYAFSSAGEIGEIAENYWMAICRDVPFSNYAADSNIAAAADDLNNYAEFDSPRDSTGKVTPQSVFRGFQGELVGPYLSQFMILPIPYGAQQTSQRLAFGLPPQNFMTTEADYLAVQNGVAPSGPPLAALTQPHILANGRDLANYVHIDELFQAYPNACLLLITPKLRGGFAAPLDDGNPYTTSQTQTGFGTLGEPNFKTIVAEVSTRALKAVWFQKWFVHRRLRPEAFGARLHFYRARGRTYDFNATELAKLNSPSGPLERVHATNGTWLLPMAFPEGCPVHPAYGAGHATVAGACVTILKALFKEEATIVGDLGLTPMMPNADGSALLPYTGADASLMTVGGELNKLASKYGCGAEFRWRPLALRLHRVCAPR